MVPLLEGLAAVVMWGGSFIATKVLVAQIAPSLVVWVRFGVGVLVLAAAAAWRRELAVPRPRDLALFALLGLQGITFHQWLQATALVTSQASTSGWIVASTPVFIALLSALVLRERLAALRWLGIVAAAAGVILVVTAGHIGALFHGRFGRPGDILIVISAPNWAIFSVLSRRVLRDHPAARVMLWVMTFGWLGSGALLLGGPSPAALARLTPAAWGAMAFLAIGCSGLAYVFWYDALKRMPASRVGALLYLEPLVAQAVASAVLGEPVTGAVVLGGGVILAGVWLATHPGPEQRAGRNREDSRTDGADTELSDPTREFPRSRRTSL